MGKAIGKPLKTKAYGVVVAQHIFRVHVDHDVCGRFQCFVVAPEVESALKLFHRFIKDKVKEKDLNSIWSGKFWVASCERMTPFTHDLIVIPKDFSNKKKLDPTADN